MNIWERFENVASTEEVATAKVQFTPLEEGDYDVLLESIEASENKDGLPMIKGRFRIISNNRVVFYNQNLQNINYPNMTAQNIAEAILFIGALKGEDIEFEGMSKLASTIESIETGTKHRLNISYGKKDLDKKFPKLKIIASYGEPTEDECTF